MRKTSLPENHCFFYRNYFSLNKRVVERTLADTLNWFTKVETGSAASEEKLKKFHELQFSNALKNSFYLLPWLYT